MAHKQIYGQPMQYTIDYSKVNSASKGVNSGKVSKKRIKSAAPLKIGEVPYPFTSREQYERSLQVPVGKEWNALTSVRKFSKPGILTTAGHAIAPVKRTKKKNKKVQG